MTALAIRVTQDAWTAQHVLPFRELNSTIFPPRNLMVATIQMLDRQLLAEAGYVAKDREWTMRFHSY